MFFRENVGNLAFFRYKAKRMETKKGITRKSNSLLRASRWA